MSEDVTDLALSTHRGDDDSILTQVNAILRQRIDSLLLKISQIEKILRHDAQSVVNNDTLGTTTTRTDREEGGELRRVLNEYIAELEKLYDEANGALLGKEDLEVPVEIIEYVDDGGNPDECMRRVMGSVLQESQQCHGKSMALQSAAASIT